jgi:hypothetical protein
MMLFFWLRIVLPENKVDGRKVYVETLKTPWIGKDGKVLGVLGVCHDISAPTKAKPLQKK